MFSYPFEDELSVDISRFPAFADRLGGQAQSRTTAQLVLLERGPRGRIRISLGIVK